MRVRIVTEYCGRNNYRVAVVVDGRAIDILSATCRTVGKVTHDLCEKWSRVSGRSRADRDPARLGHGGVGA